MSIDIMSLRGGDRDTFDKLFYSYYPSVRNYVLGRVGNDYFAEEVAQLTFIRIWEKRSYLTDELDINVQVFRIAKTVLIDQLRSKCRKKNDLNFIISQNPQKDVEDQLFYNISYKDTFGRLNKILDTLPPVRKRVFELSKIKGFSHKEISGILNISTKTVECHISKALKQIKPLWSSLNVIAAVIVLLQK
ncbi:MAG: hypothetical protein DI598_09960 [Pseudopedobacter saltans]|uniref:RNA polymerase, sigma-24 subunit, ECF subfamily n=1 Tax=Pseudopedobacter saltans TaxID=151895 RepID=A0A2W5F3P3_9SPHI|nr:MAG: hypothetical protein DI598_09960 [Pseudopedobacter saltans]